MNYKLKNSNGFTMIELLVVISIIGILAALATVSFNNSQKQARDTARKSDLKQYQNALEADASQHNGFYVKYSSISGGSWGIFCNAIGIGANCPNDPKYPDRTYTYKSDLPAGSGNVATRYVIYAQIETDSNHYWLVCSNGKAFDGGSAIPTYSSCD